MRISMADTSRQADDSSDEILQWVTFNLAGETYGVNVMQVQEVLRLTDVAPVPGAPNEVMGIINLRGNVVTVIDTRIKMGLDATSDHEQSRIVIVECNDQTFGLFVDAVTEVVYLSRAEMEPPPPVGGKDPNYYICGVSNKSGRLVIFLDLETIFESSKVKPNE
jgi:purine-binding chemotaxis protein CheW